MPIKVTGLKQFGRRVANRRAKLNNMHPAYKRAIVLYHAWIITNFDNSGSSHENGSLKWLPLKNPSAKRGGASSKILIDTGGLRRDWDMTSSSKQGAIQSAHDYSAVHEDGAVIKKKNGGSYKIPQRKIFPEIPQAHKIIAPAFDEHFKWNIK